MTRRRSVIRALAAGAAFLSLAACDSRLYGESELAEVVEQIRAARAQDTARPTPGTPAAPIVTREMLAGFDDPLITAAIPKFGTTGLLGIAERNGGYVTWLTPDRIGLVTREGVVTATRGLVGDLASARVPDIRRTRGAAVREHFYYGPNQRSERVVFSCNIATDGAETIRIVGADHATTRVTERCESGDTQFTNVYWIENTGLIRKSRQWVSALVDYVDIEAVNR